ncbi:MAG TPA: arginine--tRNA ligase, partial [Cryomorphaceae bacterium]|nr:arginine--tRNA ligase [Cryomorphaceae bacterium]
EQNPSEVASYLYDLAKSYNGFYQVHSVINAETPHIAAFRASLSTQVAGVLSRGLLLLGIEAPKQM